MAEADHDLRTRRAEPGDLRRREGKMDELHGGRFAGTARAIDVCLGYSLYGLVADPNEGRLLDAAEARQEGPAALWIVDLEEDGGNQFAALGDKRVVGAELVGDLGLAAFLDVQHLLHLQPHAVVVLEMKRRHRSDLEPAILLLRHQSLADSATGMRSAGVISCFIGMGRSRRSKPVCPGEQFYRVQRGRWRPAVEPLHPLNDVHRRQWALGGDVGLAALDRLSRDRPPDL